MQGRLPSAAAIVNKVNKNGMCWHGVGLHKSMLWLVTPLTFAGQALVRWQLMETKISPTRGYLTLSNPYLTLSNSYLTLSHSYLTLSHSQIIVFV